MSTDKILVKVKDLPDSLRSALSNLGYGRTDIAIEVSPTECLRDMGGQGYRSFACIVNIATGRHETTYGSWGGPNAYCLDNVVDLDDKIYTLPRDCAVILGREGGSHPVYATITLPPDNIVPNLLPAKADVTELEARLLGYVKSYTPAYRKPILDKHPAEVDALVARGLLKRNKAGSISITTEGKNAAGRVL